MFLIFTIKFLSTINCIMLLWEHHVVSDYMCSCVHNCHSYEKSLITQKMYGNRRIQTDFLTCLWTKSLSNVLIALGNVLLHCHKNLSNIAIYVQWKRPLWSRGHVVGAVCKMTDLQRVQSQIAVQVCATGLQLKQKLIKMERSLQYIS